MSRKSAPMFGFNPQWLDPCLGEKVAEDHLRRLLDTTNKEPSAKRIREGLGEKTLATMRLNMTVRSSKWPREESA